MSEPMPSSRRCLRRRPRSFLAPTWCWASFAVSPLRTASPNQRQRLLKLCQLGEIDDEYLARELRSLRERRARLEAVQEEPPEVTLPAAAEFEELCLRVSDWVRQQGADGIRLVAQALQINIDAATDSSKMTGVIPEDYASPDCHADVRAVVADASPD